MRRMINHNLHSIMKIGPIEVATEFALINSVEWIIKSKAVNKAFEPAVVISHSISDDKETTTVAENLH